MLNVLWAEDPFKVKWSILAKAYSIIRDRVGKQHAPLDKFLLICCPEIGTVSVNNYLRKLNWVVGANEQGELTLTQTETPDLADFEAEITNCTMTEIDIIEHCVHQHFFPSFYPFPDEMVNNQNQLTGTVS